MAMAAFNHLTRSQNGALRISRDPINTTSTPGGSETDRSACRSLRLTRFLSTAPPTFFPATRPYLKAPSAPSAITTTMPPARYRRPVRNTRSKSGRRRSVETARRSCGETLATLVATRLDDLASRTGLHPMSETVVALAAAYFGLICPFHGILYGVEIDRNRLRPLPITVKAREVAISIQSPRKILKRRIAAFRATERRMNQGQNQSLLGVSRSRNTS